MSDETESVEEMGGEPEGEIPRLREALDAKAREAEGHQDRALRAMAELDNAKKRAAREREDYTRYANESLLREILPVLDNFERALQAAKGEPAAAAVTAGVELIQRELFRVLEKFGVSSFESVGQPFDPTRHEAVAGVSAPGQPEMTVVGETARGYMLNGRVLRPAMVTVAMGDTGSAGQANGAAA
jgi:molecular chaperone GrpE